MPVTMSPLYRDESLRLQHLLELPPSLLAALLPWWSALVLALFALVGGGLRQAFAWAVAGLLYSGFVSGVVLWRLVTEDA